MVLSIYWRTFGTANDWNLLSQRRGRIQNLIKFNGQYVLRGFRLRTSTLYLGIRLACNGWETFKMGIRVDSADELATGDLFDDSSALLKSLRKEKELSSNRR